MVFYDVVDDVIKAMEGMLDLKAGIKTATTSGAVGATELARCSRRQMGACKTAEALKLCRGIKGGGVGEVGGEVGVVES